MEKQKKQLQQISTIPEIFYRKSQAYKKEVEPPASYGRQLQGWKKIYTGFTLIELLVVVLIIGILSAIAFPQYNKAVRKARLAEAKILLKTIGKAGEAYILANPDWNSTSFSIEDLDVSISTETKNWRINIDECVGYGCAYTAEPKFESGYHIVYMDARYDDNGVDYFSCSGDRDLCKSLGATNTDTELPFGDFPLP